MKSNDELYLHLRRNRQLVALVAVIQCLTISLIILVSSRMPAPEQAAGKEVILGSLVFAGSIVVYLAVHGSESPGLVRRLASSVPGIDYPNPPLNDEKRRIRGDEP